MTMNEKEGLTTLHKLFYLPLVNDFKTLEAESAFITAMKKTENNLLSSLERCSIDGHELTPSQLSSLLEKDWIRASTTAGRYFITAKGIWEVESKLDLVSPEKVVDYIDKKKFGRKLGDSLTDNEKVLLLLFISLRSYSPEIQINRDLAKEDVFVKVLDDCADLLKKTNNISQKYQKPTPKSGEDYITYIPRSIGNPIPLKTRNIFQVATRANYLKIYDPETGEVSIGNLSYLLWKIFGGNLTLDQEDEIRDFCNRQFNCYMNDIYPPEMQDAFLEFTKSKYTNLIPDALAYIQEQKQNWEMTG